MSSVFLERNDLMEFGIDPSGIEDATGRRVCWIERFSHMEPEPPFDRTLVGLHIYFCEPNDADCESCQNGDAECP